MTDGQVLFDVLDERVQPRTAEYLCFAFQHDHAREPLPPPMLSLSVCVPPSAGGVISVHAGLRCVALFLSAFPMFVPSLSW
jgi:hypothetical protein